MLTKLAAYVQVAFHRRAQRIVVALEGERAQGTVEYVGLILLVSLLMVGMVAAMKGFNGKEGTLRLTRRRLNPNRSLALSGRPVVGSPGAA